MRFLWAEKKVTQNIHHQCGSETKLHVALTLCEAHLTKGQVVNEIVGARAKKVGDTYSTRPRVKDGQLHDNPPQYSVGSSLLSAGWNELFAAGSWSDKTARMALKEAL